MLLPGRIAEVDVSEADLTIHLVVSGPLVLNVDRRFPLNYLESLVSGGFGLGESDNVGSEASQSKHAEKDAKKDRNDVAW